MNDVTTSARLGTHEAVCAERYKNILATMTGMSKRVGRLENLVWAVAGSLILGMAGLIVTLFLTRTAHAHIADHPEWTPWFTAQFVPDGSGMKCCDESDAYLLGEDDLRIVDHEYEARIKGQWRQFKNTGVGHAGNTVMGFTGNPTGRTVAWVWEGNPRCLSEATGS